MQFCTSVVFQMLFSSHGMSPSHLPEKLFLILLATFKLLHCLKFLHSRNQTKSLPIYAHILSWTCFYYCTYTAFNSYKEKILKQPGKRRWCPIKEILLDYHWIFSAKTLQARRVESNIQTIERKKKNNQ